MSDDPSGTSGDWNMIWIGLICILGLLGFYLISPVLCIFLLGDVPPALMALMKPLEWLYWNFGPYERFIDWGAGLRYR